jgi:hypothetical protein
MSPIFLKTKLLHYFFGFLKKSNKNKKLKRKTIAKSKAKENLKNVKNLLLLLGNGTIKCSWWRQLYSLKCHSLCLQAQSDATREVSPTMVTRGYNRTLVEVWVRFLIFALQANCNIKQIVSCPQLTVVGFKHQQLARLTKPKEKVRTRLLVIFKFKQLKVK